MWNRRVGFIWFTLTLVTAPLGAVEWQCHARLMSLVIRPIPVVSALPSALDSPWASLGELVDEASGRQIPVQRPRSATTPVRRTMREWVGWRPGTYKFYIAIQENHRLVSAPPSQAPRLLRLFKNTVMRVGNLMGIQPSLYNYHWSLYVVDESGEIRGFESPGPLRRAEARHGLSNRNSILMPVTFASPEEEQAALSRFQSVRRDGIGRTLGCGHSVCQVLGAEAGQRSLSLCGNFRKLVHGAYVRIDRVIVLGTQISAASDLERSAFYTDLGYITPILARPLILIGEFAALLWLLLQ